MYKLHWICQQPTPYNDFLFRSIAHEPDIDLTVHFMKPLLTSHPWKTPMAQGFQSRFYNRKFGIDWHLVQEARSSTHIFFVVGGWHEPTVQLLLSDLAFRGRPFALWTDTPNVKKKRNPIKWLLRSSWLRWLFRHATYVMGTGQPACQVLEFMGCSKKKLINFPYFVNLDVKRERVGISQHNPLLCVRFMSCGRLLNSFKGHDIAISALAIMHQLTNLKNFEYIITGTGPDLNTLKQQVRSFELNEHVQFLGWREPTELVALYAASDVLIHPSRVEPYGVAVLEAMATGLTVLGSNVCGSVQDRIQHNQNGLVHHVGNAKELAEQMAYLLTHPDVIKQMGDAAKRTAEEWPVSRGVKIVKAMLRESLCV